MWRREVKIAAAIVILAAAQKKRRRSIWQRDYFKRRDLSVAVTSELLLDNWLFVNFARMSKSDFETLVGLVGPKIKKNDTVMRKSVPVSTRLAITLRFLATGDSYHSLMYLFRAHYSTISVIIPEVIQALNEALKEYIKLPSSENEWKTIARNYENQWNFPHCIGSMDGKHIAIKCPPYSGSKYYNYKNFYSIVLFALVDADYKFTYVHVGCQGRISDGGVFRHTAFGKALIENRLGLPPPEPLPGRQMAVPYVVLADDAFPLMDNIMKPYTVDLSIGSQKRVYNYRISRGRRIVENSFGLLAAVFRILHTTIDLKLNTIEKLVMCCTLLHNFMRRNPRARALHSPLGTFDEEDIDSGNITLGSWRANVEGLVGLQNIPRKCNNSAQDIRDEFMKYFMSEQGRVPWQDKYLEPFIK